MTALDGLETAVHKVPLPQPEADGTLAWSGTTVITVIAHAGATYGLGWTYGPAGAASVVEDLIQPALCKRSAFDIPAAHLAMRRATRNAPTAGLATLAISAVDVALWDLKARLLDVPLTALLGRAHDKVPLYGSGGFVSMTDEQLTDQLTGWIADGFTAVKIKIAEDRGGNQERDLHRIGLARGVIGVGNALMVDANGGYDTKQALAVARAAAHHTVVWFEEPVSSDRLNDLALLRGMTDIEVTAGEYGTSSEYFERMCAAAAVDCLQVDATRCGGYTGFLAAAAIADAHGLQVSSHCAPHLHAPVCAAVPNLRHAEFFADHVAADEELFDGLPRAMGGFLRPQDERPGHGITLR
jgi:L-alanine-DL-glutamate epimerase-like enolase superfamily enzyme